MHYQILFVMLLSNFAHAMENDSYEPLYGLIKLIKLAAESNNPGCAKAYEDLEASTLNSKHVAEDEASLSILNGYKLLNLDHTVRKDIRELVKEKFSNNKKRKNKNC
ncbi:hypothetical protein HYX58_05585 [Candidatus Dependentiae bacterium]|nr:hypothetical protein [Candidatus Dependentiae bacterium]